MPIPSRPIRLKHPISTLIPVLTDVIAPGPRIAPVLHRARPTGVVPGGRAAAGGACVGPDHDADVIAERLRGRFTHFLTATAVR